MHQFYALLSDRYSGMPREKGATAVEYGLLVGLIAVVIIGAVILLGGTLDDLFGSVNDRIVEGSGVGELTPVED